MNITPTPTDEEAAAIVAAVTVLSARPAIVEAAPSTEVPRWRFSGRWWIEPGRTRPVLSRR